MLLTDLLGPLSPGAGQRPSIFRQGFLLLVQRRFLRFGRRLRAARGLAARLPQADLGMDPLSDQDADVNAEALRDQAAVQTARYPEGGGEVRAEYDETERIPLEVDLNTDST